MTLKEKFQLAWENKGKIAEGLWNTYIAHKPEIEQEAQRRIYICSTNTTCGYYDPEGKPETSVIPGQPACSACHCNISLKCHSPSSYCSLRDLGREPLWEEMMTGEQEKEVKQIEWEQQFKYRHGNP
jgi:hypothetical protein